MTPEIRYWGICITCLHRKDCLSFQNGCQTGPAIWNCNEYETAAGESGRKTSTREITPVGIAMGLCSNCASQNNCCFPFREGGVWFCGDFR